MCYVWNSHLYNTCGFLHAHMTGLCRRGRDTIAAVCTCVVNPRDLCTFRMVNIIDACNFFLM